MAENQSLLMQGYPWQSLDVGRLPSLKKLVYVAVKDDEGYEEMINNNEELGKVDSDYYYIDVVNKWSDADFKIARDVVIVTRMGFWMKNEGQKKIIPLSSIYVR